MVDIWIAFVTGLTTGGLTCMVVQGGLLTSSLATQVEQDMKQRSVKGAKPQLAAPIALFLAAKLVAYTLIGFLLGALGSTLELTQTMRAVLQFGIGIFMLGNAMRMFNVHPIFRYFSFEPPSFVTRFIRKSSKSGTALASPLLLGAMTVLIPCGIAQSMMAAALGTANPLAGATLMFAFTLGTTPVFFALSYTAARLGSLLEKNFTRLVAVMLIILGIYSIDSGLNLVGAPSISGTLQQLPIFAGESTPQPTQVVTGSASDGSPVELTLYAKNTSYDPKTLNAPAGHPIKLKMVTQNTRSCSLEFTIPELKIQARLPVTGEVMLDIPAQPKGKVMRFSCSMGMYTGQIVFN
jgi:sulfite exporter TauE/SafE